MTAPSPQSPSQASASELEARVHELDERVHELDERVRLYEAVLATGPVFVHIYDREVNPRWSSSILRPELGYERLVPRSAAENYAFVHPQDRPTVARQRFANRMADPAAFLDAAEKMVADGEVVRNRYVERADDRILEQLFLPVPTSEHSVHRMWVYRDVTAQFNLGRQQKRLLEMERTARRSLEEQNDRLRELDELKNAFVATVSHELRTPLTALRSYIELLLDPEGDALTDEQRGLAEAVKRGSLRLARLVDDLLVLAQLGSRSLPIERTEVSVPDVVADAVEEVRRIAPADVTIERGLQSGPPIATDRIRLMQILSNLLGNAAKFARSEVRCSAVTRDGNWVIEVTDDGPGIAGDELERIFEPFFRGRGAGRAREGTGLGLPISVQLAELLGGSLTVANQQSAAGMRARVSVPITDGGSDRVPE